MFFEPYAETVMSRRAALIISLLLLPLWGRAVNLRFHAMPETSYYGGIHSIAKDSLGRIWFSGFDAIYMYNGVYFTLMNEYITRQAPERYWSIGWLVTDKKGCFMLLPITACSASIARTIASKRLWTVISGQLKRPPTARSG